MDINPDDLPRPFLIHVFYRNGTLLRPDDFATRTLPPHISTHATKDTTLGELGCLIAADGNIPLPKPAIGTRLVFQLVFPDTRGQTAGRPGNSFNQQPRFASRDIGSVVIGGDGPGTADDDFAGEEGEPSDRARQERLREDATTLSQLRYGVGDYISCAILPPLASGIVAPASLARRDRIASASHGFDGRGRGGMSREPGFGRGRGGGFGGPGHSSHVPFGEWRRGEKLPDPPAKQIGRGRRY